MIDAANKQRAANLSFIQGSVYSIPLESDSVAVVFSNALFQHLETPLRALKEMQRVLKEHGIVAIRIPDWSGLLVHPSTSRVKRAIQQFLSIHSRSMINHQYQA